jgi:hypothetical protein
VLLKWNAFHAFLAPIQITFNHEILHKGIIVANMKTWPAIIVLNLLMPISMIAQKAAVINGFVRDKSNGESLPSANVVAKELKIGTTTNAEGYFVLTGLPKGVITVRVSFLGYKTKTFQVNTADTAITTRSVQLESDTIQAEEVVVTGDRNPGQTGRIVLNALDISSMPSVGESDVFRSLQMMPGVKAISEISSGLFVRGGSADQNLILLDGTVVYNPSHLFGFFSTFNTDAIKDVELMKGGYPAEYGGRLSSVLNVTNIDGDRIKTRGKASVSLISARLTGEGPLGSGSWFFSGRRTYLDQFVEAAKLDAGKDAFPLYYFYDMNGKLNQDIGESDKVSVVGYFGKDKLNFKIGQGESLDMWWGNTTVSGKWTHVISPTVFSNFNLTYSKYSAYITQDLGSIRFDQENSIDDLSLKGDINFYPTNDHLMKLGFWSSQYKITYLEQLGWENKYEFITRPKQIALYAQDEWNASPLLKLQTGVRAEHQTLTHSTTVGPRFSARYFLSENFALKFATGIYYQYLNAIPIGESSGFSPFDIWVPLNDKMNPSRSIDYVLGIETEPIEKHSLKLDGYYKTYSNVLFWIGEPTNTNNIDELFYEGTGRAFGAELFLQRQFGTLTGSIGYTLAWTYRTFPELNDGKEFMPKFDRRHDLSVVGNYELGNNWKLGTIFTYSTGQSFTAGVARAGVRTTIGEAEIIMPVTLYNYRLPPYHRLDIVITKKTTFFGLKGSWYIQIYNIYSRKNVWYREFDADKNPTEVTDITLLPMIPTFGIDFEF